MRIFLERFFHKIVVILDANRFNIFISPNWNYMAFWKLKIFHLHNWLVRYCISVSILYILTNIILLKYLVGVSLWSRNFIQDLNSHSRACDGLHFLSTRLLAQELWMLSIYSMFSFDQYSITIIEQKDFWAKFFFRCELS